MDSLKNQVGGSHYKNKKMQPIQLIVGAKCDFIQGNIIKYISRHEEKNGKEDIQKAIQYAQLALDLCPEDKHYCNIGLGFAFCRINEMSPIETQIIISTLQQDYKMVERHCNQLITKRYSD